MSGALRDPRSVEPVRAAPATRRLRFLGALFDRVDSDEVIELIAAARAEQAFKYIVTPNVDHVVRLSAHPELDAHYEAAWLTLCDSRPISLLAKAASLRLPVVTGSDLTISLFDHVIRDGDSIALIAPNEAVISMMRAKYPRLRLRSYVPPPGVSENPQEIARCVAFVLGEKADFVFLAIGCPQSEKIAHALSKAEGATGICLCIGAALEFMTGMKKRAPRWMNRLGIEWLHRLASEPKRLWRRYILAVMPFGRLVLKELGQGWTSKGATKA
jgi:exopolysaccharide biosynthesis WecB/TagA/CpsF family protein